jgi:acyl-CoA hydrolase
VANLLRDGDTLQFGIGAIPLALAAALTGHRRLRIHGGMVSAALRTMWQAGAIDRDARITTGVVLGDTAVHDFIARLKPLWLTDVARTHDPAAIARIPRFIAINSAVEVDLFGQVNAERAHGVIQAGAGGVPAAAQGALASAGGRMLICLPATARKGAASRIVPALTDQALCTLPRYLVDAVVTEHGVAELRGLSLDARAQALIAIAAIGASLQVAVSAENLHAKDLGLYGSAWLPWIQEHAPQIDFLVYQFGPQRALTRIRTDLGSLTEAEIRVVLVMLLTDDEMSQES